MDKLPDSLLLDILSRLDDSADVARCLVAYKPFDAVSPGLRSINLQCPQNWFITSKYCNLNTLSDFKMIFLHLVSKLETVESLSIHIHDIQYEVFDKYFFHSYKLNLTYGEFSGCLDKVSQSLKSLSLSTFPFFYYPHKSNVLMLISTCCQKLVDLRLQFGWLSVNIWNPMPMLASLTVESIRLEDQHLTEFNERNFPNLKVLNLLDVKGLQYLKIHLLNLQTCHLSISFLSYKGPSLTLITPNLITLNIKCLLCAEIHVEAPMLSHFHIILIFKDHARAFTAKKFEGLKILWMDSLYIGSLLSEFPITKTVEDLTLYSTNGALIDVKDSELTLGKLLMIFPNVSSLRIGSDVWSKLEACLNPESWEILDGMIGLKTICAYLMLVDPSLTLLFVAYVLDQCKSLSEVCFLIHVGNIGTESESFMSKCLARWPALKWRWGIWSEGMKDTWITNAISN